MNDLGFQIEMVSGVNVNAGKVRQRLHCLVCARLFAFTNSIDRARRGVNRLKPL